MSILRLVQNEPQAVVTRVNPYQTSQLVGSDIKRATNNLVELMLRKDGEKKNPDVIAITGMGGIGKTTLAQNIFNHQKIQHEFSIKIWVCITQNFNEVKLLNEIIKGAKKDHVDLESKAQLLPLLRSAVSEKPFLLVLDDVWRSDLWDGLLRVPLQSGAISSRVLVTTRDQNVAKHMKAVHIHPVEQLPVESGWELLRRSVACTVEEEEEMQSLRDVGIQLVEKCHGLPLAIKTIAGLLTEKERSNAEWEKVLRSEAWSRDGLPDDLRGALYLSYEDLPSHLKQCFLYLSLFPPYIYSREDIAKYWVAEGFAETQNASFTELADNCFEDLLRRNLIQKADNYYGCMRYKMHDLLRSLAQFLSRDESFCGKTREFPTISTTTTLRRLSFNEVDNLSVIPEPIARQKYLRTLFLIECPMLNGNELFVRFPFLRVLTLSDSGIENIPDAVGNLIHLRLLDLDRTKISNLPESVKNLKNLVVLYLSGCKSLHTLPKGITQLFNLRFIDLRDTPLSFIPSGMGRLEYLNVFRGFVIGVEDAISCQQHICSLQELLSLPLTEVSIYKMERTAATQKALLRLSEKAYLDHLELHWGWDVALKYTEEEIKNIQEASADFVPPSRLKRLYIEGYFGRWFPGTIMSTSLGTFLPQLRSLHINNCTIVQQLPPLGLLPELRHLQIRNASGVVSIGPEFLGSRSMSVSFPKLEELRIGNLSNLQEWSFNGQEEEMTVFPHLRLLLVWECPKLESLPRGLKKSPLKELQISRSIARIPDLPALRDLRILDCPSLKHVGKVDALEKLLLIDHSMESLPEWLLKLLQYRKQQQYQDDSFHLHLRCTINLLNRCLMGCEYWPIIKNIPSVNVSHEGTGKNLICNKQRSIYHASL